MLTFLSAPTKKTYFPLIVILILTAYQLIRLIAFVNVYGGIEHDGGWALTVSRDLAEHGTFTTTVSTLVDPGVLGGINIDNKFDIQAPDGRIWFRSGNPIGPASIVPPALVIKLFGNGFWALRAGSLIFYTCFLLLAAYGLYQLAGLWSVLLFQAFLFFYPHLVVFLGYEALGEMPSMIYTLVAYLLFAMAMVSVAWRWSRFFFSGLLVGLAINAKLITLWSVSGIFIWAGMLWLAGVIKQYRQTRGAGRPELTAGGLKYPSFSELIWLGGGTLFILGLWELIYLLAINRLANFDFYLRHTQQRFKDVLDAGSGVRERLYSGPEFFWDKFFMLSEVAHPQRWVTALVFLAVLLGGLGLLWLWRKQPRRHSLLAPLWFGWLVNTVWFVSLAKTGWVRHFWPGLVLAVILLSVITVTLVRLGVQKQYRKKGGGAEQQLPNRLHALAGYGLTRIRFFSLGAGVLLLLLLGWDFACQPHVRGFFLPDDIVPYWQDKRINNKYGATLPWIIIPRSVQRETITYLQQLPAGANVYYPAQHKAAEIAAQVDRIFYPLNRRQFMPKNARDVVIISPSLIAPWMDPVRHADLMRLVQEGCPTPLLANDYYMLCPFPPE